MSSLTTKVSILFSALLSTIIECLHLPPLEYTILDQTLHRVSITVRSISGSVDGQYSGGPAATNEGAFEEASQLAIDNLKEIYDIYIKDVTALKSQVSERCTNLWRLKRQQLERMAKGLPKIDSPEEFDSPEISHMHLVTLDFVQLLTTIQGKVPAQCSDMEVVEHSPANFIAWMTVTHHNSTYGCTYMCSDTSLSYQSAEQDLASKVISYLAPIYNLEVIDANYCQKKFDMHTIICKNAETKCKILKRGRPQTDRNTPIPGSYASITTPATPVKRAMRGQQLKNHKGSEPNSSCISETAKAVDSGMPDTAK